jgi:Zn-finger nucleic acid-binding protein
MIKEQNCKTCGVKLTALNMSDVEPGMCGECCDNALDEILRIGCE